MPTPKKFPPDDDIDEDRDDSAPPITDPVDVDIDDAQIEEPKDDAFRKGPQPAEPPKRRRQKA